MNIKVFGRDTCLNTPDFLVLLLIILKYLEFANNGKKKNHENNLPFQVFLIHFLSNQVGYRQSSY